MSMVSRLRRMSREVAYRSSTLDWKEPADVS